MGRVPTPGVGGGAGGCHKKGERWGACSANPNSRGKGGWVGGWGGGGLASGTSSGCPPDRGGGCDRHPLVLQWVHFILRWDALYQGHGDRRDPPRY